MPSHRLELLRKKNHLAVCLKGLLECGISPVLLIQLNLTIVVCCVRLPAELRQLPLHNHFVSLRYPVCRLYIVVDSAIFIATDVYR